MAIGKIGKLQGNQMFMVVLIAIIGLVVFSQFTDQLPCTQEMVDNEERGCTSTADTYRGFKQLTSAEVSSSTTLIMKIAILALVVFIGYAITMKFLGRSMSRKDIMVLILLGIVLWFLWDRFLVNILSSATLEEIGDKFANAAGLT